MNNKKKEFFEKQVEKLEERIFYHEMKDNWTKEDFDLANEMEQELMVLKERLKGCEDDDSNNN